MSKIVKIVTSRALILFIQLLASSILLFMAYQAKLFPNKYLLVLLAVLLALFALFWIIIQTGKNKEKRKGKISKRVIITKILSLLLSIVLGVGCLYVNRGLQFFDNVQVSTQKYAVNVIVLREGKYGEATLKDLDGKNFGISYQKEKATLNKALAKMEETIDTQKYVKYDKYIDLVEGLYDGSVDAIVVGNEYKSYLEVNHPGFDEETRIVKVYEFEKKSKSTTTQVTDVTENSFTVYVTGIDTYGSVSTVSRSDVNLIVNVNPKTKQILMVSIPRDCQINLHKNGKMDKLTHTGIYGVEETVSTIEDFLDVEINYYARTNFSGITNIVDALGGVTIDSDYDFTTLHGGYHIVKGKQHMDGDKALCFVRERYALPSGDFDRGRNQQKLLKAMLEKAMSPKIITNFENILTAIEGCFETDMSSSEIRSLINMQLDDMADWDVFNVQIMGQGYLTSNTYSMSGTSIYVMKPYASSVRKIRKLIDNIHDGKKIKDADVKGLTGEPEDTTKKTETTEDDD